MALTYDQSGALMQNQPFKQRIKVACLRFADSIMNEQPNVAGHTARYRWAQQCFMNPGMASEQVAGPVVMDPAVQQKDIDSTDGDSTIDDAALQGSVEATVAKFM